jgi:hypothetical protein
MELIMQGYLFFVRTATFTVFENVFPLPASFSYADFLELKARLIAVDDQRFENQLAKRDCYSTLDPEWDELTNQMHQASEAFEIYLEAIYATYERGL